MSFKQDLIDYITAQGGCIPLDEYMERCNANYYKTRDPIGRGGDFTTAPEISQMFGELIAAWLVDIVGQFGSPDRFTILECGPGRGTLMSDILRILSKNNIINKVSDILLLENSDALIQGQKGALKQYDVSWISDIQELDTHLSTGPLFVIANEFLDALPIKQYIYQQGAWFERGVRYKNSELVSALIPAQNPPKYDHCPKEGKVYEDSPAIKNFMTQLSEYIKQRGGGGLFIDYGYPTAHHGDTFQAVQAHKYSDPFRDPGESDLTAHVNFGAVIDVFEANGLYTYGPVTQGAYLLKLGLQARADALKMKANEKQTLDIEAAFHRLSSKREMGELFKVLAAFSIPLKPAGF